VQEIPKYYPIFQGGQFSLFWDTSWLNTSETRYPRIVHCGGVFAVCGVKALIGRKRSRGRTKRLRQQPPEDIFLIDGRRSSACVNRQDSSLMPRISKNQLIKLQKKYRTDAAIGKLYNISRQAFHQLRHRYGIEPVADKNEERNREIVRLYNEGMGTTRLARAFGISVSQAYRIVNRNARRLSVGGEAER
jgi:hypothetical protein